MTNKESAVNLIQAIKTHPKLLKNLLENNDDDLEEWAVVAQECETTIAEAQDQWNHLLMEYVQYLTSNEEFSLAEHMDFVQPYFFTITDGHNIDEDELLKAIDSKRLTGNSSTCLGISTHELKNLSTDRGKNFKIEEKDQINAHSKSINGNTDSSLANLSSLELIFLGYAKQLQEMPLTLQLKTKRKIADVMDEAALETMN